MNADEPSCGWTAVFWADPMTCSNLPGSIFFLRPLKISSARSTDFSNEYQIVVPKMGSGKRIKIRVEPAIWQCLRGRMQQAVEQFIEDVQVPDHGHPGSESGMGKLTPF